MDKWKIILLNGEEEVATGYAVRWGDGVLKIRTSHNTAYVEEWIYWPLTSVQSWRKA